VRVRDRLPDKVRNGLIREVAFEFILGVVSHGVVFIDRPGQRPGRLGHASVSTTRLYDRRRSRESIKNRATQSPPAHRVNGAQNDLLLKAHRLRARQGSFMVSVRSFADLPGQSSSVAPGFLCSPPNPSSQKRSMPPN
jgi:hypothetical protein